MDCQELEELSGAYILGAVTPEERKLVEEHIAECPHCTQMLQELQLAIDALSLSVPLVEPSPVLKERILASVQPEELAMVQPIEYPGWKKAISRQRLLWKRWSTQILAAAALILFVLCSGMTAWNIELQQQIGNLTMNASSINYAMHSADANAEIRGDLTCFSKQQFCMLTMRGLPMLEGTKVYQGWLLQGKRPVSIGLLNVHDRIASIAFQGNVKDYSAAAVSIEPGPQASDDAPRGQIIALGNISKSVV